MFLDGVCGVFGWGFVVFLDGVLWCFWMGFCGVFGGLCSLKGYATGFSRRKADWKNMEKCLSFHIRCLHNGSCITIPDKNGLWLFCPKQFIYKHLRSVSLDTKGYLKEHNLRTMPPLTRKTTGSWIPKHRHEIRSPKQNKLTWLRILMI